MPDWLTKILQYAQEHNYLTGFITLVVALVAMNPGIRTKLTDLVKKVPTLLKSKKTTVTNIEDEDDLHGITELDLVDDPEQLIFYYYRSLRDVAEMTENTKALATLDTLLVDLFTFSPQKDEEGTNV